MVSKNKAKWKLLMLIFKIYRILLNNCNLLTGRYKKIRMERPEKFVLFVSWKMVPFTKATGSSMRIKKTVVVFKYGQMDQDMMGSGETAWQMAMEDSCTPRVMSMKVSGLKIRPMATAFTLILMAADTKVSGIRINSMVLVLSNGLMVPNTKENMNKE